MTDTSTHLKREKKEERRKKKEERKHYRISVRIRDNQYNIQSRQYTEKPFTVQGLRNFELYNSQPVISQKKQK